MLKNKGLLNKISPIALIAVLGTAAYFVIAKAGSYIKLAKDLTVAIDSISLDSDKTKLGNYLTIFLKVKLSINNPNSVTAKLTGIDLNFLSGNKVIATAKDTGNISLKANGVTKALFTVSIQTGKLFTLISEAIKIITLKENFNVGIKGEIRTSAGILKIDEQKSVMWPT